MPSRKHYPFGLKKMLFALCVYLCALGLQAQTVIYVNKNSTAVNPTGASWATAFSDLRQAILSTNTISGNVQVWVAQGIYYPTTASGSLARFTSFQILRSGLMIYGGFQGTETALTQRNPSLYVTRLSGNIGSSTLKTDNTYSVVVFSGYISNTVLDGLTISDGYDNAGSSQGGNEGGGIQISNYCSVTIRNCIIQDNYAASNGGGIYIEYGTNTIENSILKNNKAAVGGGLCFVYSNKDKILNCLFINDTANTAGGGIYGNTGEFDVNNCTFVKNHANPANSINLLHGSAFAFLYGGAGSSYRFKNCIIWNNTPFNNSQIAVNSFGRGSHNLFQGTGFGTNTITGNPRFTNEALDNYTLNSSCSPAVDAGTIVGLSSDLLGNARVNGRTTDLGSYEFGGTTTATITQPIYCANGQGVVTVNTPLDVTNIAFVNTALGVNINTALSTASLSSGIYQVSVLEDGCPSYYHVATVTLTAPPVLTYQGSVSQVTCKGESTGSIGVTTILGGFPGSTLRANLSGNLSFSPPVSFAGLAAQTYTVRLLDITRGCVPQVYTVTVPEPAFAVAFSSITTQPVSCFGGNNGLVQFTPTGGTPPYSFSIPGQNFTTQTLTGLSVGTRNIVVRDALSCAANSSFTISQPNALTVSILGRQHATCNSLGSITVTATGGNLTNNGLYEITPTSPLVTITGNVLSGLGAGSYNVKVSDVKGCTATAVGVTITTPSTLSFTVSGTNNLCFGNTTATATINGVGGNAPYTYSLGGTGFQTSPVFSALANGTYAASMRDASNCTVSKTHTITSPSELIITSAAVRPTCAGTLDGMVLVTATGGTGIKTGTVNGITFTNIGTISGLSPSTFTISVLDANVCTATSSVIISPKAAISTLATPTPVRCFNENNGSLSVNASGGNGGFTYSFNNGAFTSNNAIQNLAASTVTTVIKDGLGCTATITTAILQPSTALTAQLASAQNVKCKGEASGLIVGTATGGWGGYTFASASGNFSSANTVSGLAAGSVTLRVRDQNLCTATIPASITEPTSAVTLTATTVGTNAISAQASGGTGNIVYTLNNGSPQSNGEFTNLASGSYTIKAIDQNNCEQTATLTLGVLNIIHEPTDSRIQIYPNPSNDGKIYLEGVQGSTLKITNAIGQVAYQGLVETNTFQVVGLSKGLYILSIESSKSNLIKKFVVE